MAEHLKAARPENPEWEEGSQNEEDPIKNRRVVQRHCRLGDLSISLLWNPSGPLQTKRSHCRTIAFQSFLRQAQGCCFDTKAPT
jgi:hypothetical protein